MLDTLIDLFPLIAAGIIAVLLVLNAAPQKGIRREKKIKKPDYNRCTYGIYIQAVRVDGGPEAAKCKMQCCEDDKCR